MREAEEEEECIPFGVQESHFLKLGKSEHILGGSLKDL